MAERPEFPFESVPDRVTISAVFTPRPSANPPPDELGDGWTDVPSLQARISDSGDEPSVEAASRLIGDLTERAQAAGRHHRIAGPVYGDGPGTPMFWVQHSPDDASWTDLDMSR